ncbi:hypothetical protein [Streptomyces ureilyticus]|uniref:Uncharacterized protein n=1 Tax=Streptomyces ureilyticus TaxID=1775131 RepID=A0ABX0DKM6_9ACTN|nr:hypothetical protein [Streptomyces ureilyticus]NGO42430.1 hypothetical protein [Streptomyces ureilyticus]
MSWLQHPHSRRRVMAVTAGLVAGATLPAMRAAAATTAQQERFISPVTLVERRAGGAVGVVACRCVAPREVVDAVGGWAAGTA